MIDKMREEFEKAMAQAFRDDGYSEMDIPSMFERNHNGDYAATRVRGAWWGWQASRKDLVVELPPAMENDYGAMITESEGGNPKFLRFLHKSEVIEALTKTGVAVK